MQNNQMNPLEQGAPWLANYGDVPFHLEYPNVSIADAVLKTAEKEKGRIIPWEGKSRPFNSNQGFQRSHYSNLITKKTYHIQLYLSRHINASLTVCL